MSGRSRLSSSSGSAFFRCCSASRRACSASASAPSTFTRPRRRRARRLAALQLCCGAGEDFDQTRFVVGVALKALADRLAQMIERGLDEGRQRAAIAALATFAAAPAVDALAERAQPVEHGVNHVAIGLEIDAAFAGDGVELLGAFGRSGDVAGFLQISQRRIDDAGARRIPIRGLLLDPLDDLVAVARLLWD